MYKKQKVKEYTLNLNEVFLCVCLLVFWKTDLSLNLLELGPLS